MDTLDVDKYILGETEEEFLCVSDEDNQKIAVAMIQQAELELDIAVAIRVFVFYSMRREKRHNVVIW